MVSKADKRAIYELAIKVWGRSVQIDMIFEEVGEFISALATSTQNGIELDLLASEIADVYVMLDQTSILFDLPEKVIYSLGEEYDYDYTTVLSMFKTSGQFIDTLASFLRRRVDEFKLADHVADMILMLNHCTNKFSIQAEVEQQREYKFSRLKERLIAQD